LELNSVLVLLLKANDLEMKGNKTDVATGIVSFFFDPSENLGVM